MIRFKSAIVWISRGDLHRTIQKTTMLPMIALMIMMLNTTVQPTSAPNDILETSKNQFLLLLVAAFYLAALATRKAAPAAA